MSTRSVVLTMRVGERLVTETCHSCGVLFAMVEDFHSARRRDGKTLYCPVGHGQQYVQGKTDAQKLREAETRELALRDQLSAAIREGEATRVALLRDRHRFANGVCPCCTRSFANVRRHMADQHPEYDSSDLRQRARYECSCGHRSETLHGLRTHQGRLRSNEGRRAWDRPDQADYIAHLTVVGAS